jgi:hypothetical protein
VAQVYGGQICCDPSWVRAHALLAIAWARAGDRVQARAAWARTRGHDRSGVWGGIAAVEVAQVEGSDAEPALAEILARLPTHEDAYEAVELGLVAAKALRPDDPRRAAVVARVRADAARLDARLERPRHAARVEAELG